MVDLHAMASTKIMICLSVVLCLALMEVQQARGERLQRRLLEALTAADTVDDLEFQMLLDDLASVGPETRRKLASKRGFVRLG